jgi:hypothetical protein
VTAAVAEVDRGLAAVLIEEATAAGADPRAIRRADRAMARGNRRADQGRYEGAASAYGRAWTIAGDALRKVS